MSPGAVKLKTNPIPTLLSCGNPAIEYFTRKDLLDEKVGPVTDLWQLPDVIKILKKQEKNGSWKYPGKIREDLRSREDYDQFETYKTLGMLVEKYGLNRDHYKIQKAANTYSVVRPLKGILEGFTVTSMSLPIPRPSWNF